MMEMEIQLSKIFVLCCMFSHIQLVAAPWTVAPQGPWNFPGSNIGVGYHFLLQSIFPIQPPSLASPALAGGFLTTVLCGKPPRIFRMQQKHSNTEVYSSTGLNQETRKVSNKQPDISSKGIRRRSTKPKVSRRKEIIKIKE